MTAAAAAAAGDGALSYAVYSPDDARRAAMRSLFPSALPTGELTMPVRQSRASTLIGACVGAVLGLCALALGSHFVDGDPRPAPVASTALSAPPAPVAARSAVGVPVEAAEAPAPAPEVRPEPVIVAGLEASPEPMPVATTPPARTVAPASPVTGAARADRNRVLKPPAGYKRGKKDPFATME